MSKQIERPPLYLRPGSSRRLLLFLLVAHGSALALIATLTLDWWWRAVLAAAVLSGLAYSCAADVLYRLPWGVREALWAPDGSWTLTLVSGRELEATILPATFSSTWLVVLNFRCGRWPWCSLPLFPDALDADQLRRLRVRLRLEGVKRPGSPEFGSGIR